MADEGFVSEYPLPPVYYKQFTGTDSDLKPPPMSGEILRNMAFGSAVQVQNAKYNKTTDYRAELMRASKLLLTALCQAADITTTDLPSLSSASSLVTTNTGNMVSFEEKVANVNHFIGNIQTLISEYKTHQAREDLLGNMQAQLDAAHALEYKLEKLLEESQQKLKSIA